MALLLLWPSATLASQTWTWTKPYPGIQHGVARLDGPVVAHAVVVHLEEPGVSVRASTRKERWQTVADFGSRAGCAVAVNGGFWTMLGQGPAGVAAGGGRLWSGVADSEDYGLFAMTRRGTPWISPPAALLDPLPRARLAEAVSGRPLLLERGRPAAELHDYPFRNYRHPRTAVGISRDRRTLYLFAVDGRQEHSKGMSVVALAAFARDLGAWTAINLDGGGSTTLFIPAEGGITNRPCRGERTVLNHICVLQERGPTPRPGLEPVAPPAAFAPQMPGTVAPPSVRVALVREHWVLLSIVAIGLLVLAAFRRRLA